MFASDDMYSETLENFRVFGDNIIILNAKYKKRNDIFFYEYLIDSIEYSDQYWYCHFSFDNIYINLKREVYSDFEGIIPFWVELHRDIRITAREFMDNFEILKINFKED